MPLYGIKNSDGNKHKAAAPTPGLRLLELVQLAAKGTMLGVAAVNDMLCGVPGGRAPHGRTRWKVVRKGGLDPPPDPKEASSQP